MPTSAANLHADDFYSPPLDEQVAAARERFAEKFGETPLWVAAAPGRVNLIGEHTDYNAGFVFPLAIERYVVVAGGRPLRISGDEAVCVHSTRLDETAAFELSRLEPKRRDWTSYVRGVVAGCLDRGMAVGRLNLLIDSNVPLGAGLSSSAALEVAVATLLEAAAGRTLDPVDKARLCQRAEHEYAGMPCGIMDQFSSTLGAAGKLLLIDCRAESAELVPFDDKAVSVLVINTNVKHELTGSEYAQRRSQCEEAARRLGAEALRDVTRDGLEANRGRLDELLYRRARHVVTENERTLRAADAVKAGAWPVVGELMYASHASLRGDYEVSCAELDALVELAGDVGPSGGVIGARMTGGGFGGSIVALVESGREREVAGRVCRGYRERFGIDATPFVTKPARGAHIVQS